MHPNVTLAGAFYMCEVGSTAHVPAESRASTCVYLPVVCARPPQTDYNRMFFPDAHVEGPSRPFRVLVCAARTLNVKGQSRVTLSLQ